MAVEVSSINNVFTGTNEDEFANSTSANETFTMGGGENIINFDLTNNNILGTDEIHLTPGEDLILNFTSNISYSYFNESLIKWERVVNDNNGVDLVVTTFACHTLGYTKVETVTSDEIDEDHSSNYYTYYKAVTTYYLYDYEKNDWVVQHVYDNTYAQYDYTAYGLQYVSTTGELRGWYRSDSYTDKHVESQSLVGTATSNIDYYYDENYNGHQIPINTITVKDIGAENAANSVTLQYTDPNGNKYPCRQWVTDHYEPINFITKTYDIGSKYETTSENQVLQGSFLNETFYAGYGDDTISTVGGNDTVKLVNGGTDIITIGTGEDFIDANFGGGDYYADLITNTVAEGGIFVSGGNEADTLKISDLGENSFYRDGDDLVIIQNWQYNGGSSRNSKFTVEDYFTTESKINIKSGDITEYYGTVYDYEHRYALTDDNKISETYKYNGEYKTDYHELENLVQGSGTLNGTDNAETIVATSESSIKTKAGNDKIYTSSANDTITIDGSGDKTIYVDENTGDDTIVITDHSGKVYLDFLNTSGYKFYKDKDAANKDLIIERYREEYKSVNGQNMYVTVSTGKTVIKDYFNYTAEEKANVFVRNLTGEYSAYFINIPINYVHSYVSINNLYINGTDEKDTIGTTSYQDVITPGKGKDVINIDNSGKKTIRKSKGDGNDIVNLSGSALSGGNDELRISWTDNVTGSSYQIKNDNGDDLLILYGTRVDGDEITTDSVTIKGITGGEVTAGNIADYYGTLNVSNKIRFYENHSEWSSYYNRYFERENCTSYFSTDTPYFTQGSATKDNNIEATYTSNLVTGGNKADTITVNGKINHVYTGAGNDVINDTSTTSSLIYAGSGNDIITSNSASAEIHSQGGNDQINIIGGRATIYLESGADVVNITGGMGGEIRFTAGGGDKTINFVGASDAMYNYALEYEPNYSISKYTKQGDNLILSAKYRTSHKNENNVTEYEDHTETYTINNFFNPNHAKVDADSTRFYYSSSYSVPSWINLDIDGEYSPEQNATIFEGTFFEDIIDGTDGVDIITTGKSEDRITAGKGDDFITIDGGGYKYIYYSKGDGNDTITIADGINLNSGTNSGYIEIYSKFNDELNRYDYPDIYSYKMDDNDLVLYRTFNNDGNAVTDSIKITGIKSSTEEAVEVTPENIASSEGGLNISHKIYISGYGSFSATMTQMQGDTSIANDITTSAEADHLIICGAQEDKLTLLGNTENVYTDAGNDTVATSATTANIYTAEGNDKITINDGTAYAYAGTGNDTITINGGTAYIYSGAGSDTIKINGGQGTINVVAGMGNDTVIFEKPDVDGAYNFQLAGYSNYSSKKSGNDLVISGVYTDSNGKTVTETTTIKELFGKNQISDGNNIQINGYYLPSVTITGIYNAKTKVTTFEGSNYGDTIRGTKSTDVIITGAGNDEIIPNKGADTIKITGAGNKYIYNYKGDGNETVELAANTQIGNIYFYNESSPEVTSHKIDKSGNLTLYRTYIKGDKFTTESTTIKGISSLAEEQVPVTYATITDLSGGLNISGKIKSGLGYLEMSQGKAKKANKISTEANTNNLILGGSKVDTITLNGATDYTYTGAGADKITVATTEYAKVYTGSGNDTITLNTDARAEVMAGKGNDTISTNGSGSYYLYAAKGDGNDTVKVGKNFNGVIYAYIDDDPNQMSYQIDKSGNLTLYRTYVNGDKITTEGTKITGIKSKTADNVAVTYDNIYNASGGLNISGKTNIYSYEKNLIQGNATKVNKKLNSKAGISNLVTGGSKADTVTLNGSYDYAYTGAGADKITVNTTGSSYVYAGSGNDTININSTTTNCYVYSGKGNDKINISGGRDYVYITAGEGNNTITFNGNNFESCYVRFSEYNSSNNYWKSGNDLLVKATYRNAKGQIKTETHTIKGYFKNEDVLGNKVSLNYSSASNVINDYGLNLIGKYDGKQKATVFTGTQHKDKITGTAKVDVITTGAGDDKITPGKGNDTITIDNSGDKTIVINNGDGNDTLKWTVSEPEIGTANLVFNKNDIISSKKSGTDLVITRTFESGSTLKSENTTIKGYYDANGDVVEDVANKLLVNDRIFNPEETSNRVNYKTTAINVTADGEFAVGTAKADTITITANNASVNALAGNDTINVNNGNAFIAGGYGKDKINLNTTGTVTVYHATGDGNDIINFGENTPSSLTISTETPVLDTSDEGRLMYYIFSGTFGFQKSGNDLIYSVPVTSKMNPKTETITITNYFNDEVAKPEDIGLYFQGTTFAGFVDIDDAIQGEFGLWTQGVKNGTVTTYTGLDDYHNNYSYNGTGKTVINGANDEDYYFVNLNSKSNLTINDKHGHDALIINSNYKNLRAFFNVNASEDIIVSDNTLSDNFMIFNKGSLTSANITNIFKGKNGQGVINIDNFFEDGEGGDGIIESIVTGNNIMTQLYNYESGGYGKIQNVDLDSWVGQICEKVSSWLSTYSNGKYADKTAFDVISRGNKTDINAMLKVYNSVTYDAEVYYS
ncbi:MAG: hypothetical protein K6A44_06835 [bacterium]|nr:hypothetical protein [bacterium]